MSEGPFVLSDSESVAVLLYRPQKKSEIVEKNLCAACCYVGKEGRIVGRGWNGRVPRY